MNIIDRCIFQELRENQFIMLEKRMTDESTFYIFHFIGIGKKGRGARKDGTKIFGYLMNDFFSFSGLHFASDVGQGPVLWFWSLERM